MSDISRILSAIDSGDESAPEALLPVVYGELRRLAAARLSHEAPGQTLQPTDLVHAAYVRLVDVENRPGWNGRGHFFSAAAEAMRRILIERARKKSAIKHGGALTRVDLDHLDLASEANSELLLLLNDALMRLAERDPPAAALIKLRFFVGLPNVQAAELLGIPERTAKRSWAYARAWLYQEIRKNL